MEKTLVVVLLLCALSLATEEHSERRAQSYSSDLHNELVDIRVKLAQDRLIIEQLQKEKEELKSKVKELEDQESHLKPLKDQLKAQASELQSMKTQSDETKDQLETLRRDKEAQASELQSIKTQSNETKDQLETLRRDKEVGQVAFSAVLRSRDVTLGPYSAHTTLAYTHVLTNVGNAYNPTTGIFTAPVRGAYHFEFYNVGTGSSFLTAVVLVKNEEHIVANHENQASGFGTTANAATLLLEAGDVVMLRLWKGNIIYDNQNRHSTFSGRLLFTM